MAGWMGKIGGETVDLHVIKVVKGKRGYKNAGRDDDGGGDHYDEHDEHDD